MSIVAELLSRSRAWSKQGERMTFLALSDRREHCQAVLFPETYWR